MIWLINWGSAHTKKSSNFLIRLIQRIKPERYLSSVYLDTNIQKVLDEERQSEADPWNYTQQLSSELTVTSF